MQQQPNTVLVVEDTESLRDVLCTVLRCEGYNVTGCGSAEEGLELLKSEYFTLILSDLKLPGKSGLDFIKDSRALARAVPTIVMTAYGSIDIAVEAMKLGAVDFITKPFDPPMLVDLLKQIVTHQRKLERGSGRHVRRPRQFLSQSPKVDEFLDQVRKVAPLTSPVLILGESGTGKELIARQIHQLSPRAEQEFVAVNCASMPGELLESEFFGHDAGAFTGAFEARPGLFEVADKGTIFLDEIGNMPHELQVKLLRTLQESEVKRLGSPKITKVDVRVISATNTDLQAHIKKGVFREDLYYRLGVVTLEIPPLRERPEDIELLANYYLKHFCQEFNLDFHGCPPEVIKKFQSYNWPGNVRELENTIERALIFSEGNITADSFSFGHRQGTNVAQNPRSLSEVSGEATRRAEIEAIVAVLNQTKGNKSKAAKVLGISYKTLLNKVKEYKLESAKDEDRRVPVH